MWTVHPSTHSTHGGHGGRAHRSSHCHLDWVAHGHPVTDRLPFIRPLPHRHPRGGHGTCSHWHSIRRSINRHPVGGLRWIWLAGCHILSCGVFWYVLLMGYHGFEVRHDEKAVDRMVHGSGQANAGGRGHLGRGTGGGGLRAQGQYEGLGTETVGKTCDDLFHMRRVQGCSLG